MIAALTMIGLLGSIICLVLSNRWSQQALSAARAYRAEADEAVEEAQVLLDRAKLIYEAAQNLREKAEAGAVLANGPAPVGYEPQCRDDGECGYLYPGEESNA